MFANLQTYLEGMSRPRQWGFWQKLFIKGIYFWFLFNVVLVWNDRAYIWGSDSVLLRFGGAYSVITNFAYALVFKPSLFSIIFPIHILSALLSLSDKPWTFIPRLLVWLTGILLYYAGFNAFNAGFILMLLLAFFTIPFYSKAKHPMRNVLNHISILGSQMQIMLVYGSSALYKLSGDTWVYGEAVYYTLSNPRFSREWILNSSLLQNIFVMKAMSYLALVYQLIFPIGVWIRRVKKPLLIFGVVFHLFIGYTMNLWDFSLAMIIGYLVFFRE